MYLIDGHQGTNHVTAAQVGDFNIGVCGSDDYVYNVGERFSYTHFSDNRLRIYDGAALIQGRRCGIAPGGYEDVRFESGTQGMNRIDIVAIKYEKDSSNKESVSLAVVKGTPKTAGSAVPPSVTRGNMRDGDTVCYMPLYRVFLTGINISSVTQLFKLQESIQGLLSLKPLNNGQPVTIRSLSGFEISGIRNFLILEFCNENEMGRAMEFFINRHYAMRYITISYSQDTELFIQITVNWIDGNTAYISCDNLYATGNWSEGSSQKVYAYTI